MTAKTGFKNLISGRKNCFTLFLHPLDGLRNDIFNFPQCFLNRIPILSTLITGDEVLDWFDRHIKAQT